MWPDGGELGHSEGGAGPADILYCERRLWGLPMPPACRVYTDKGGNMKRKGSLSRPLRLRAGGSGTVVTIPSTMLTDTTEFELQDFKHTGLLAQVSVQSPPIHLHRRAWDAFARLGSILPHIHLSISSSGCVLPPSCRAAIILFCSLTSARAEITSFSPGFASSKEFICPNVRCWK